MDADFLADLDALSDSDHDDDGNDNDNDDNGNDGNAALLLEPGNVQSSLVGSSLLGHDGKGIASGAASMQVHGLVGAAASAASGSGSAALRTSSRLLASHKYVSVMATIKQDVKADEEANNSAAWGATPMQEDGAAAAAAPAAAAPNTTTDNIVTTCNALSQEIDSVIVDLHTYLKHKYSSRFPELASLVPSPVDYAKVVKLVGNSTNLTSINFDNILPPATVMVVSVTAAGENATQPLPEDTLASIKEACDVCLRLDADKAAILAFVQAHMAGVAPNLSAIVGTEVASKLMGAAGGLLALSRIPACNIQVLGAKKRSLAGFSNAGAAVKAHQGFIAEAPAVLGVPPHLRPRIFRLVASKCALAARLDALGGKSRGTGEQGRAMAEEIASKAIKFEEGGPQATIKPLPIPDAGEQKKSRRGGRRFAKQKERLAMSEMAKQANRLAFSVDHAEEEVIEGDESLGLGMLGKERESGRLRLQARASQMKLSAKAQKKLKGREARNNTPLSGAASGLASSLAFTPVQGIELIAGTTIPGQRDQSDGTKTYFKR
ncbi:U4/U6 small nuclear ribonucleoprotein PRP31 [Pseudoscourfieldia marina]